MTQDRSIPSLDGLRAVSVGMVVVGHMDTGRAGIGRPAELLLTVFGNGRLGVSVFFAISGFLITTLLVRENERSGRIDLGAFYIRRTFRIFPAFYCYLGTLLVLGAIGLINVYPETWLGAALYVRNYWPNSLEITDWHTAHSWSLAVEEQFYLAWPLAFVLLGTRRGAWLAAAVLALSPVARLANVKLMPSYGRRTLHMTHTQADALMVGCLAALLLNDVAFRRWLGRAFDWRGPALAIIFLLLGSPNLKFRYEDRYLFSVGLTLEAFAIMLVILWAVERPGTSFGRFLNLPPVRRIGVLSYSLYLWQQLFTHHPAWWSIPATLLCAEASYRLVERPSLRIRDRVLARRAARAEAFQPA